MAEEDHFRTKQLVSLAYLTFHTTVMSCSFRTRPCKIPQSHKLRYQYRKNQNLQLRSTKCLLQNSRSNLGQFRVIFAHPNQTLDYNFYLETAQYYPTDHSPHPLLPNRGGPQKGQKYYLCDHRNPNHNSLCLQDYHPKAHQYRKGRYLQFHHH